MMYLPATYGNSASGASAKVSSRVSRPSSVLLRSTATRCSANLPTPRDRSHAPGHESLPDRCTTSSGPQLHSPDPDSPYSTAPPASADTAASDRPCLLPKPSAPDPKAKH